MVNSESLKRSLLFSESSSIVKCELQPANIPGEQYTMHPKEFAMFEMNNIPIPEDDLSISYNYNSSGFRSDDFDPSENRVVFAGCSEGEGLGGKLETTWPRIVFDQLNDIFKTDRYYNLSVDNFGYQKIISNCLAYIDKYGAPKYLVVLFPDIARTVSWHTGIKTYSVEWTNPNELGSDLNMKRFMDALIGFIGYMHMFERYCQDKGTQLVWSTWSHLENGLISDLAVFNNFVTFDYSIVTDPELRTKMVKRDGHQGEYQHMTWAINIINYIRQSVQ